MNWTVIAITWSLLGQVPNEAPRFEPHVGPGRRAPAAKIEEAEQPGEAEPEQPTATEQAEPEQPDLGGQQPAEEPPADPPTDPRDHRQTTHTEAGQPLDDVERGQRPKMRAPELVAEALENPRQGALVGTPVTLAAVLARSQDRAQQLKLAQAYWKLAAAQADYHWSLDNRDRLAHHTKPHTSLPATLSARANARAEVRDAQVAAMRAQQELEDLLGGGDMAQPLASDRPHVGDYRTDYERVFSGRTPPPRIRLIHRTLPARREAINAHGEAIVASLDAVEASGEAFQTSGQGLVTILATLDQLKQERKAFMTTVRDYNQEIAEYAFAVAPPGSNPNTLAALLIRTANARTPATPKSSTRRAAPNSARRALKPVDELAFTPEDWTSNYLTAADDPGLYQALVDVSDTPERTQKLANLLHWDRNLPKEAGTPVLLGECLRNTPAERRLPVITAYWRTRERAARYQALADQVEQLNALPAIAINLRSEPGMVEASVRMQATRKAAHAALLDAEVVLWQSQFDLMQATGRPLDAAWILPASAPQSGRYLVGAARKIRSASGRHWNKVVLVEHEKLEERADSVIQCDVYRAAVVGAARDNSKVEDALADEPLMIDAAVRAIARQRQATLTFLRDVTNYNIAITHYVLATLPAGISTEQLVHKLVVGHTTQRES